VLNIDGLSRSALYVGCSRARTLTGLYLEGEFKAPACLDDDPIELEMCKVQARKLHFCKVVDPKSIMLNLTQNQIPVGVGEIDQNLNLSASHVASGSIASERHVDENKSFVELLEHSTDVQHNALVIKIGNVSIYQEDMASLSPGAWLTDAVRL